MKKLQANTRVPKRHSEWSKNKALYIMAIPGVLYYIIFKYIPLFGSVIAFQNYNIFKGIAGSAFVGLDHFRKLFGYGDFTRLLTNTIMISLYDILFSFTAPIILALLLNEVRTSWFKRTVQSVVYLPHFLSWVVLGGIISTQFLSIETGLINQVLKLFGIDPIFFLASEKYARGILIASGIWKDIGWNTIVYLAALTAIDPTLYEAASVDGAGHMRRMWNITIPSIMPTVVILLLLKIGSFMEFGFERVWVFMNGTNASKIETFDTYVYQIGLAQGQYSYATAVGLFKSAVGFMLLMFANTLSKKINGNSLF